MKNNPTHFSTYNSLSSPDFIIIGSKLLNYIDSYNTINDSIGSDHLPIYCNLKFPIINLNKPSHTI